MSRKDPTSAHSFSFRWRIRTLRTWKICRTSTTSKSTRWRTEVRRRWRPAVWSLRVWGGSAVSLIASCFCREWNERHDAEGAGEGEADGREDVLRPESQATGEQSETKPWRPAISWYWTDDVEVTSVCVSVDQDVVIQLTDLLNVTQALLSDLISEELPEWKQRQQIACIGGPPNACVDQLQNWWDGLSLNGDLLTQTDTRKPLLHIFLLLQVHSSGGVSPAGPSAPEEAAGVGAEVHLRQRPHHTEEGVPGGPRPGAPQEPPLQVQQPSHASYWSHHNRLSVAEALCLCLCLCLWCSSLVVERQPCMPTHPQRPLVLKTGVQFTVKLRWAPQELMWFSLFYT